MKVRNILLGVLALSTAPLAWGVDKNLKGEVKLDGSSTVFPIAEAAAEEFQKEYPPLKRTKTTFTTSFYPWVFPTKKFVLFCTVSR